MKLMVIGAYGNLGSELRRQTSDTVVAIGRDEWDGLTARDLSGVDVVIHAAADIRTPVNEHPTAVLSSGPMLTARLLELMGKHGTPRLIYVSSCSVYGNASTTEVATPCCPLTINGQLNLLNERLVEAYCEKNGIEWEVYRLFNTFGGMDRFSIVARIIAAAHEGKSLTIHNYGHSQRDFIHVADIASILLEMILQRPPYRHINVGTGRGTSTGDLISTARECNPNLIVHFEATPDPVAVSVADTGRLLTCIRQRRFIHVRDSLREAVNLLRS